MGQNPVNPRPDLPPQPRSRPDGPMPPNAGRPVGPGYGFQGPQGPAQGPREPFPPSYPPPYGPAPYGSPYGPRAGAGQPGAGQGYPYAGAPRQPYAGPPMGPAPRKMSAGRVAGVVVGALVLILVVAASAYYLLVVNAAPSSTEPGRTTASTAALQGYLDALAAGDADRAKRYAVTAPADSPLLTNDFLKAAVTKSPVTEIHVDAHKDVGTSTNLSASYKLAGSLVQASYRLTKVGTIWKLDDVVTTVDRPSDWGTLGVTINDVNAPSTKISLFPGVYQLATGTSLLTFDRTSFTVDEPSDYVSALSSSEPSLTDAGKTLMISQSQAWLTRCLGVQDTNPKDCGMNTPLPDGVTLAAGSLKRTVDGSAAPFSDATPQVSYGDPTRITLSANVSVKVTAADPQGNTYSGTTSVTSVVGTINGETITVDFPG